MKFKGGVILAADGKTSNNIFVANRFARKITRLSDRIATLRMGSAAGTQLVCQEVRHYLNQHRIELSAGAAKLKDPSVVSAASLIQLLTYNNKDFIAGGFVVAGIDDIKGPQIYQINNGGSTFERNIAIAGSGGTYILTLADVMYRPDMSRQEAIDLAIKLVNHAVTRDGSSGGMIRYVVITEDGKYDEYCKPGNELVLLEDICH